MVGVHHVVEHVHHLQFQVAAEALEERRPPSQARVQRPKAVELEIRVDVVCAVAEIDVIVVAVVAGVAGDGAAAAQVREVRPSEIPRRHFGDREQPRGERDVEIPSRQRGGRYQFALVVDQVLIDPFVVGVVALAVALRTLEAERQAERHLGADQPLVISTVPLRVELRPSLV